MSDIIKAEQQIKTPSIFSANTMDEALVVASKLSNSNIVPKAYQGQKGEANILIAIEMANRTGASLLAVMQNLHVISGKPSWGAPYIIAMINSCGRYSRLKFRFSRGEAAQTYEHVYWVGEYPNKQKKVQDASVRNDSCIAYCQDLDTGEELESSPVDLRMAVIEGWWTKPGSKWPSMTDQMLKYRAAAFFSREHCPEMLMGMHTVDEVEDYYEDDPTIITVAAEAVEEKAPSTADNLNDEIFEQEGENAGAGHG